MNSMAKIERKMRVSVVPLDEAMRASGAPIFVACNGRQFYIKQGAEVTVPESIVKILSNAMESAVTVKDNEGIKTIPAQPRFAVTIYDSDVKDATAITKSAVPDSSEFRMPEPTDDSDVTEKKTATRSRK